MIPVPDTEIKRIYFNEVAKKDSKYADLLRAEYEFCSAHEEDIVEKANSVYHIGCNPKHRLYNVCCRFDYLETKYKDYLNSNAQNHS